MIANNGIFGSSQMYKQNPLLSLVLMHHAAEPLVTTQLELKKASTYL